MRSTIFVPLLAGAAILASGCEKDVLTPGVTEALAQEAVAGTDAARRGGMPGRAPLGRLLELREELALTAEQVTRLEGIASELAARTGAVREQLRGSLGEPPGLTDEQREAMRARRGGARGERPQLSEEQRAAMTARRAEMAARRQELRPLMEELATHHRAAMDQVREILTDEQEAKLRELRPERAQGARGMRPGRPGARGVRGRAGQ